MQYNGEDMEYVYITLHLLSTALLLFVTGAHPRRTSLSRFELDRRLKEGSKQAKDIQTRERLLVDVFSLQRALSALLIVIISLFGALAYHPVIGFGVALIIALEAGAVANMQPLQRMSQRYYERLEPGLLRIISKHPGIFRLIRGVSPVVEDQTLDSREELIHLVEGSGGLLSDEEKKTISGSLSFGKRPVSEIMTPRAAIDSVRNDDMLGPLLLNELHQTGHSRFPVVAGDIDHVVGILHIQDLLAIRSGKQSTTVESSMEPRVFYIHETQTLDEALGAFIRTHHHLFVVINEFRETVGLLSLEDVIETLLGRQIVDEFDSHEDLRAVAARNAHSNNHPTHHTDI